MKPSGKSVSLTPEQQVRADLIKKEFDGLISVAQTDWNKINKGDKVKAVQGAGIITHPSYYVVFDAKLLEGKIVRKTVEKCKYGKSIIDVHSFSVLWSFDKIKQKEVKIITSKIVHDKGGLVANQIFLVK